jgi:polysaccharide pyruvyl transferase WcaK-like protein
MTDLSAGQAMAVKLEVEPVNPVRRFLAALKHDVRVWLAVKRLTAEWRRLSVRSFGTLQSGPIRRLIILPCDPATLVGSKGDEAMMQAVVQRLAALEPDLKVGVVTATVDATEAARKLGFAPLPAWREPWSLEGFVTALATFRPDALVVIGADVLDGYYSPNSALRMLTAADIMARRGVRTAITGFSFNDAPSSHVRPVLDGACPALRLNVRDRISLARFRKFSRAPAALVADVAFALQPDRQSPRVAVIAEWIKGRRAAGDTVLAFNLHPMLIRDGDPAQVRALTDSAAYALQKLAERHPVSVLLLSHDYRGARGDDACLSVLHGLLDDTLCDRLAYPLERLSAAELKAVAGEVDGVVTGRMHLAIATLGMGVPVAAMTYQGKFQGLFGHFGLPESLLVTPEQAIDDDQLLSLLMAFVSNLPHLRAVVAKALPTVLAVAQQNFSGLVPGDRCPEKPFVVKDRNDGSE